jgi:two-component system, sensor histidine kinase YesM
MKKLYKLSVSSLKNLTIKQKLLLSYLILIIIPLGILALLTYNRSSDIVTKNITNINTQAMEELNSALEYTLQYSIKSSNIVIANKDLQEVLLKDIAGYEIGKQIDDFKKLSSYLESIQFDQNVYRVRLYIKDGLYYDTENTNFFSINTIHNTDLYKKAIEYNGQIYWTAPYNFKYAGITGTQNILSGVRMISNHGAYGEFIGVVSVDLLVQDIKNILRKSTINKDGFVYLINKENQIITSSDDELLESKYKGIYNDSFLPERNLVWKKASLEGQDVLVYYKDIRYTGWKLAVVIPVENVLRPSISLRNYTFIIMISIGFIAYFFAMIISNSTIRRIRDLIKTMKKAEQGDLTVKVKADRKDEIGELEKNFNHMLTKIEELAEEKFKVGKEAKNAELIALQAQINPHFLYNTLELITCKALKYKAKDITDLVNSMAQFYRLSLSNGRDIVSIGDEIAQIETYVYIQNLRFEECIKLEIDVDERIPELSILKLVLQPLVENAILHGIMERDLQNGTIKIKGILDNEDIILKVIDDGVGMTDEEVLNIFLEENNRDGHGYGVKNVNKRLKINYGEQYGLTYKSVEGKGTTVEIRIPSIKCNI